MAADSPMTIPTPHDAELGIALVAAGDAWAEFSLEWRDELMMRSALNVPASAPIISVMESACEHAIRSAIGPPVSSLALSLRVDYLRPALPGRILIGRAECTRVTKRIAFAQGIAHEGDEDDPVANVSASFFYERHD